MGNQYCTARTIVWLNIRARFGTIFFTKQERWKLKERKRICGGHLHLKKRTFNLKKRKRKEREIMEFKMRPVFFQFARIKRKHICSITTEKVSKLILPDFEKWLTNIVYNFIPSKLLETPIIFLLFYELLVVISSIGELRPDFYSKLVFEVAVTPSRTLLFYDWVVDDAVVSVEG